MSRFDLVLADSLVIDGSSGATPFTADIGVSDGLIAEVGDLSNLSRDSTVAADGLAVAPGFIDTHVHSELAGLSGSDDRFAPISQGVTTTLTGADGFGWVGLSDEDRLRWWQDSAAIYGPLPDPLPKWAHPAEFLRDVRATTPGSVVPMIPHGNIRAAVMGESPREPSARELDAMCALVGEWLDEGAVGMASGLDYLPGRYAGTDEVVRLCEVIAERGGVYASHLRLSDLGRGGAWREAAEIGRRAGLGVRIAHEKLDDEGAALFGEVSARADVTIDTYLYPAGCTSLAFHVPPEMLADGVMALARRLRTDIHLASDLAEHLDSKLAGGSGQEVIIAATTSGSLEGNSLRELAERRDESVGETVVFLLRDEMPCSLLVYVWQAPDESWQATVERTLQEDRAMIASDGIYHGSHTHPRGFGAFARVLGELARERSLISLPEAVHKMTGLPANAYGITDRGAIEPGQRADLVVFDPESIDSPSDFGSPRRPPVGVDLVLVGGETAWRSDVIN